ncbi:SDR family NAD(P)-dependent oxidoreductase, partial [Saccharomonospora iraqiensis]|uniref:SDR family NAD(P)-dependent oxidoreductase n=1 Tax=Saccharomonospora iraqiensis TaxID=52698 RepID=UPI00022E0B64
DGVAELADRVAALDRAVDVLALNAGIGVGGAFAGSATDREDQLRVLGCNITGTVDLAKRLVPDMVRRGSGRVLVSSSTVARLPGPYQATYNASKAFLYSFSLALRAELRGTGVTVTAMLPGLTDTDFFNRARMTDTRIGATTVKDDPARVAREAFAAVTAGRGTVVTGPFYNRLLFAAGRWLPDRTLTWIFSFFSAPGSARTGRSVPKQRSWEREPSEPGGSGERVTPTHPARNPGTPH